MIEFLDVLYASFTAYICACVIGVSSIFEPVRTKIKQMFPKLKIGNNKHFIECRLCLSFWTALFSVLCFDLDLFNIFAVYGLSYFLATQER